MVCKPRFDSLSSPAENRVTEKVFINQFPGAIQVWGYILLPGVVMRWAVDPLDQVLIAAAPSVVPGIQDGFNLPLELLIDDNRRQR